ncbi:MAG: peptide chain release factor 2 [Deltaproteobacteria bacterium]|nr:peptide chain release factor 2 [Deltaproteobacteria bacterium]
MNLRTIFDIEDKKQRLQEVEKEMTKDGFWDDPKKGKPLLQERTRISNTVQDWEKLRNELDDAEVLYDLAVEEDDAESISEAELAVEELAQSMRQLSLRQMLGGENDERNAIVSINAGAGGTEAQDWAEMLLRMYLRWCERKRYEAKVVDRQPGDEAGIKSVTFTATGPYAYGYLKAEAGIHRLVRISPFDAGNRRHTSFASVFVVPEIDDTIDVKIDEKDLRIDTFRSSGAGGQHVNKTDSGVRITHIPTGIVVQCQQDRSQHRNKAVAMTVLKARLYEQERLKKDEEMQALHDSKQDIAWGSQIRSYTLQPYQMVKDHRIDLSIGNVSDVLDGNIDPFIEGVLLAKGSKRS